MNDYTKLTIVETATIVDALKQMDSIDVKLLIVTDQSGNYKSLISIGDLQRAIISNVSLDNHISHALRKNIRVATTSDQVEDIKKMILDYKMEYCPVINGEGSIEKIYFWDDVFGEQQISPAFSFDLPVVIMAGGYGTRLRPLTHVIPKPMIPINEKTMLEEIFHRFSIYGSKTFFISVNYKAKLIEYYLNEQNLDYELEYFTEPKPLGTAGSLSLLKGKIDKTFFVSNCDILIEQDYSDILEYHQKNENEITLVAAIKHYDIPYGTVETGENGNLLGLKEKPELSFMINSGMYILEPHLLDEIPEDTFFHITHLIEKVKERSGKVGVFPVSEKSWKDIGEWSEYSKYLSL